MNLLKTLRARRYLLAIRRTRSSLAPGDRVRIRRGDATAAATVLDVQGDSSGVTRAYVRADDSKFAGWLEVDAILPPKEATR